MKKKMNRKGFTLVELLAVVVILLAISAVAISSISAAIERQNVKKDNAVKQVIISYAEIYFEDYKNTLGSNPCVDVSELITVYSIDPDTLRDSNNNVYDGSVNKDKNYQDNKCAE